jgi:hypothetical protein
MGPEYEATLRRARDWIAGCDAIGQLVDGFTERARTEGFWVRVLPEPGSREALTMDRRPHRINVRVAEGVISEVDGVY